MKSLLAEAWRWIVDHKAYIAWLTTTAIALWGLRALPWVRLSAASSRESAESARIAVALARSEAHDKRTPQFDINAVVIYSNDNSGPALPLLIIDYTWGPALATVMVTIEAVRGFQQAFYLMSGSPHTIGPLRPGDRTEVYITRPEQFGGKARVILNCAAANGDEWTVENVQCVSRDDAR